MEIDIDNFNGTPVFYTTEKSTFWPRIYGVTYDKETGKWLFPAFPPFLEHVLHDFEVTKEIQFTSRAQAHLDNLVSYDKTLETVKNTVFPVSSYEHQLQGTAELLYNYRWILQWETGTGKTKPVVDAVFLLNQKALVLCPLVAIDNWIHEVEKYSNGKLKAVGLTGAKKSKLNRLKDALDANILVIAYDTAKLFSVPKLFKKSVQECNKHMRVPHSTVKEQFRRLNNEKEQLRFVQEWIAGRPPREIKEELDELLRDRPQWITDFPYKIIVADESHKLKNIRSARTKRCSVLARGVSRRILLTGTLSQGDPRDLYPQLRFLAPYTMPENWKNFCDRHLIFSKRNKRVIVGYRNLNILNHRVTRVSSVRKLNDCVDIPSRQFITLRYTLGGEQRAAYNYAVKDWVISDDEEELDYEIPNAAVRVNKLLQICSGFVYLPEDLALCDTCPNLKQCVTNNILLGSKKCIRKDQRIPRKTERYSPNPKLEVLTELLERLDNKVIIWATLEAELDDIEKVLNKGGYEYVRVDGSTAKNVKKLAMKFNEDPNCTVYLAQISTGIAITLNAAKYSVYYSRSWSSDDRLQSLGRNYRIGQDKKTVVYDICAHVGVEKSQLWALRQKENIAHMLTHRTNCLLCKLHEECRKKNVKPWTPSCVFSTRTNRVIAKAVTV